MDHIIAIRKIVHEVWIAEDLNSQARDPYNRDIEPVRTFSEETMRIEFSDRESYLRWLEETGLEQNA